MRAKLSSKGQIVLPDAVRKQLGLEAGATLEVTIQEDRIILIPVRERRRRVRLTTSPRTGLPVLTADDPDAPKLTSEQVKEMLADFP